MLKTLILSFGGLAASQSLTSLLSGNSDLSSLTGLLQSRPELLATLSSATNITVLAPNNAAISALLNSSAALANNSAAVDALLQYHVLNGIIPSTAITNQTAFVPSLLTNSAYANVTGGQRVGAVRRNNTVSIVSGLLNNSTVVTADSNFTGESAHILIMNLLTCTRWCRSRHQSRSHYPNQCQHDAFDRPSHFTVWSFERHQLALHRQWPS